MSDNELEKELPMTYKNPMRKMAETPIFFFRGIWSFQITCCGNNNITKSENELSIPPVM